MSSQTSAPVVFPCRTSRILQGAGASSLVLEAAPGSAEISVWLWNRQSSQAHPHNSLPGLTRGAEISRFTLPGMFPVNGRNSQPAPMPVASATHRGPRAVPALSLAPMDSRLSPGLNSTEAQVIFVSPDLTWRPTVAREAG